MDKKQLQLIYYLCDPFKLHNYYELSKKIKEIGYKKNINTDILIYCFSLLLPSKHSIHLYIIKDAIATFNFLKMGEAYIDAIEYNETWLFTQAENNMLFKDILINTYAKEMFLYVKEDLLKKLQAVEKALSYGDFLVHYKKSIKGM